MSDLIERALVDLLADINEADEWIGVTRTRRRNAAVKNATKRIKAELSRLQSLSDQNRLTGGWRAVPEEPTREMLNAAIDVDSYKLGDISPLGFRCSPQMLFEDCWKAMLAASPPLPLPGGEEKR